MKLLALDTSSVSCTVALQLDQAVTEQYAEKPREHTRLLLPMIQSLLQEAGAKLSDLDAIVLGNGPGSFIGMRIAASVAQGLAYGAALRIVPVSSLAAVAAQVFAEHDATEILVAQDAHMHEVYLGIYTCDAAGLPQAASAERLQRQDVIAELLQPAAGPRIAAGDGWRRYPALLELNRERIDAVADIVYPRARYLLPLAARSLQAGAALAPGDIEPAYLRQKVAEKPAERS